LVTAIDGVDDNGFGASVSMDGDRLLVGAPRAQVDGNPAGAAYVFERVDGAWVHSWKLTATYPESSSRFGKAVALSGDYALVGAYFEDAVGNNSGAAYIFKRTDGGSWVLDTRLDPVSPAAGDSFGRSVGLIGDVAMIGSPGDDDVGNAAGSVSVYRRTGDEWTFEQKVYADNPQEYDNVGRYLATDGQRIVSRVQGMYSAYTVVFAYDGVTWAEEDRLSVTPRPYHPYAISGDLLLAADAEADVDFYDEAGRVVVHRYLGGTWTIEQALTTAFPTAEGHFGSSVYTDGTTILVGSELNRGVPGIPSQAAPAISLFTYEGTEWVEQRLLTNVADSSLRDFATSVSSNGTLIAVGSPLASEGGEGGALVFDPTVSSDCNDNWVEDACEGATPDCNNNGRPDECDVADGTSADCLDNGIPDECEPDCNGNGTPDQCDIWYDVAFDCDFNGVPDECETDCNENGYGDSCDIAEGSSADTNGNDIPDECECPDVVLAAPVAAGVAANRYLSITPGNIGEVTALRVVVTGAPEGFEAMIGRSYWVGEPRPITESAGSNDNTPPPTFLGANLGCTPYYWDWGVPVAVQVFGQAVIPGLQYAVQSIPQFCLPTFEESYSVALPTATSVSWGDVTSAWDGNDWPAPNGTTDFIDIGAVADKFRNEPSAPSKVRTDLASEVPDGVIDFTDISYAVDAFLSNGYPFDLPPACE
jgi:hypothetical protein